MAAINRVRDNGVVTAAVGRLSARVCVITGVAGGVGQATARRLAQEGATVVGVDLVERAVGELCLQADVTDEAQVRDLYARVRDELGRIDVLFNNTGVNDPDDGSASDNRGLLASDDAGYVTASAFPLDGGITAAYTIPS
jgi:short-subunit dehydrogenase involved in D-alanine esterification of teichoic acids